MYCESFQILRRKERHSHGPVMGTCRLIGDLEPSILNVLSARGIFSAKDVLCKPELDLMELLDLPLSLIKDVIAQISLKACPPYRSAFTLMKEREKELGFGHLRTHLNLIDSALHGGIPFGALTEVVGPAGFGKTQLCLMLSIIAVLPVEYGGLDGNVIYFDTECKFHPGRMAEMAQSRFGHIFSHSDTLRKLATRVLVYHPCSLEEFASSLQELEEIIIENHVKLLVIDSIAALMQGEYTQEDMSRKQRLLGHQAALLKYLAESFRIPVFVTNQVRTSSGDKALNMGFTFEETCQEDSEAHLTAALGTSWAHAVNIRLILESLSGQRFLKIAKSPISAVTSYPYEVTTAGLVLSGRQEFGRDIRAEETEEFEV